MAERLADPASTAPQRAGVEDWRAWWAALAAGPAMRDLLAERARRFPDPTHDEHAPTAEAHIHALQAAGFSEVGFIWQRWETRLVLAVR